MKLTILGSGSPESLARRASSGYLVEVGGDRILFDCGGGVVDRLIASGRVPGDISHLFFSHLHSDHMIDYPRLVHAAWDEGASPLPVWGPAPIAAITERCFGPDGWLAHDLVARTEMPGSKAVWVARGGTLPRPKPMPVVTEIAPGARVEGDGWVIETIEVEHAQPFLMCTALRLQAGQTRFVYSGDSALSPELEALSTGADTLLHWCYRLDGETLGEGIDHLAPTPSEIAAMAQRAGVKRLLLTHFRVHMDTDEGRAGALAAARAVFDGEVEIVEDLNTYQIGS